MADDTFSFGSGDSGISKNNKAWKATKDSLYRIGFVWFPDVENGDMKFAGKNPKFIGADTLYVEKVGYIKATPEILRFLQKKPADARKRIGTILALFPVNSRGELIAGSLLEDTRIMPWVIGSDKYDQLKLINNNYPFSEHDLNVTCQDTHYQKMTFGNCRDSVIGLLQKKIADKDPRAGEFQKYLDGLNEEIKLAIESLPDTVSRDISVRSLAERMNGGSSGAPLDMTPADQAGTVALQDSLLNILS